MAEKKPVGEITHFYDKIGVAIIKCATPLSVGNTLHFKGHTTDFIQTISSMQYDHKDIEKAKKGQEIGVKVDEKVREGDVVYLED